MTRGLWLCQFSNFRYTITRIYEVQVLIQGHNSPTVKTSASSNYTTLRDSKLVPRSQLPQNEGMREAGGRPGSRRFKFIFPMIPAEHIFRTRRYPLEAVDNFCDDRHSPEGEKSKWWVSQNAIQGIIGAGMCESIPRTHMREKIPSKN